MVWTMVGLWAGPTAAQTEGWSCRLTGGLTGGLRVHPMAPPKVGQRAEMSVDSTVSQSVWTMVGLTAGPTAVQKVDLSADRVG